MQCLTALQTKVFQIYACIIYLANGTGAQSNCQEGLSGESLLLAANGAINSFTTLLRIKKLLVREVSCMVWGCLELV